MNFDLGNVMASNQHKTMVVFSICVIVNKSHEMTDSNTELLLQAESRQSCCIVCIYSLSLWYEKIIQEIKLY